MLDFLHRLLFGRRRLRELRLAAGFGYARGYFNGARDEAKGIADPFPPWNLADADAALDDAGLVTRADEVVF